MVILVRKVRAYAYCPLQAGELPSGFFQFFENPQPQLPFACEDLVLRGCQGISPSWQGPQTALKCSHCSWQGPQTALKCCHGSDTVTGE